MPRKPIALPKAQARRIWLRAQRLDEAAPFGDGPEATRAAVEHLGYVQIDTINVVERCHHQILYTRIPAYQREHLRQAQTVDKTVFEYWTHALSYVPTRDMRFFVRRDEAEWQAAQRLVSRGEGRRPAPRAGAHPHATARSPSATSTMTCWWRRTTPGRAASLPSARCSSRSIAACSPSASAPGMLKTYELMTRHFGWDAAPKPASEARVSDYLLDRALRSQGVVSLDSICHLDAPRKPAMRRLIERARAPRRAGAGRARGRGQAEHWVRPEVLDPAIHPARGHRPHPLSVRSAGHPAQAAASLLRLRAPLRGLRAEGEAACSATSPSRCWSATRSSRCSTSRPTASAASC